MLRSRGVIWILPLLTAGCSAAGRDDGGLSAGADTSAGGLSAGLTTTDDASPEDATAADDSGDPTVKFDTLSPGEGETGGPIDICKVNDRLSGVGSCEESAPPDSFDPAVQWAWGGDGALNQVIETPLVLNFTDDNGDGEIDLCDIPDIIVAAYQGAPGSTAESCLYVLDGATGAVHFKIPKSINFYATPAAGDIDGDGRPEIVTTYFELQGQEGTERLVAFDEDGTELWTGNTVGIGRQHSTALYDIDADGDVEILYGNRVADHNGVEILNLPVSPGAIEITFAANLDGDPEGQLEIIIGWNAFRNDGSVYYTHPNRPVAHAQVADIDADGLPEVVLTDSDGISVLQHDGTVTIDQQQPAGGGEYWRPLAIHDVDGDDLPEILVGSNSQYVAVRPDMSLVWSAQVSDGSGFAAGTAFDFLGSGTAQAMYSDENLLYILGGAGETLLSSPRQSWTETENPVVADVDNDGSAEIVVVSNGGGQPPVQVIRDVDDRWIQARRIWNQHAYHVTNVREDGTIPQDMANNWEVLNTFRTQAQIEGGGLCNPQG